MPSALLAASFIDEARLRSHVGRDAGGEDDVEVRLTRACNRAIAWMETRTARRLKARNYRTQVTVATVGETAADAASITLASTASVRVGDDVLCAGLDVGVTVQSITNGATFVPSKRVLATIADGTAMTFGSKPLFVDVDEGEDACELQVPESPMSAANLWALYWLGDDNVRTAVDLTYARYDEALGQVRLRGGWGSFGAGRYEFECRAGYEEPSATAAGHPREWEALAAIQLRVAEVYFSDDKQLRGRASTLTVGGTTIGGAEAMPADIESALRPFWRLAP